MDFSEELLERERRLRDANAAVDSALARPAIPHRQSREHKEKDSEASSTGIARPGFSSRSSSRSGANSRIPRPGSGSSAAAKPATPQAAPEDMRELSRQIRQLQIDRDRVVGEAKGFKQEIGALNKQVKIFKSQAERLSHERDDSRAECKELREQLVYFQREKESKASDLGSAKSKLETHSHHNQQLQDELARLKESMRAQKQQQRNKDDSHRKEVEELHAQLKRLERQRAELLTAFKRQLKLIDVLKRQKAHLEAASLLDFTEAEFAKALGMQA